MTTTYKRAFYIAEKTGYGTYRITKETRSKRESIVTHNALIWDWMNDDSDKKLHKQALQQLAGLFTK